MSFDENPFIYKCEKEDENAEGFQISRLYWLFSSDIVTVKGLKKIARSKSSQAAFDRLRAAAAMTQTGEKSYWYSLYFKIRQYRV